MAARDFNIPDDFPELTIPEKASKVPDPDCTLGGSSSSPWHQGDRVLAPWEPHFLYAGTIAMIEGQQVLIEFDDGDSGWVQLGQLRPLTVKEGQEVLVRRSGGQGFYFHGTVIRVRDQDVCLHFDGSQGEAWTSLAAVRVPCPPNGPEAVRGRTGSHRLPRARFGLGDRVWAPWNSGTLFAGTIEEMQGDQVHIAFDDGDGGWVFLQQLLPLEIPPGLRVAARWKNRWAYYAGTVVEVQEERILINYDDGDREWTSAAALAVFCDPSGPDARPTKVKNRAPLLRGWLIPILIGVVWILLRASCR
jgi:hypothetical protein